MHTLVFATRNKGKIKEMRKILGSLKIGLVSADEAGFHEDVVENGSSFEENALLKATAVTHALGRWSVADDTGLCIDALDGKPGVRSSRWAGVAATDQDKIEYLLSQCQSVPIGKRTAYFKTAVALVGPDGIKKICTGIIHGSIPLAPRGMQRPHLPYDTVFIPDGSSKTLAEMTDDEKNSISHRGMAFRELKKFIMEHNE